MRGCEVGKLEILHKDLAAPFWLLGEKQSPAWQGGNSGEGQDSDPCLTPFPTETHLPHTQTLLPFWPQLPRAPPGPSHVPFPDLTCSGPVTDWK